MKLLFIVKLMISILFISFGVSCKSKHLPNVINPSYESYNIGDEKGYKVKFNLSHDSILPSAVVINRIKQDIAPESKKNLEYNINVIVQSRKIFGFKPNVTDSPNGIFFKTDTADVFKPINFKLK